MVNDKKRQFNVLKIWGFSLYFLLLFVERLMAVILSPTKGAEYALTAKYAFNYIAYSVTAVSLVAGTVLFLRLFVALGKAVQLGEEYLINDHAKEWSVAAAVMLFGGMMHTGYTFAGLQFAAYGFLIAAFVVRAVEAYSEGEDKFVAAVSVVYLTLFSMCIPVCYISFQSATMRGLFYAAEFSAVFLLVPAFCCMMFHLMKGGVTSFSPVFPIVMCLLSGATVALGWNEHINLFVLVFASLTLLCYLTVVLVARNRQKHLPIGE